MIITTARPTAPAVRPAAPSVGRVIGHLALRGLPAVFALVLVSVLVQPL